MPHRPQRPSPVECIICGASHPDLAIEDRVQLARARKRTSSDADGCGRTMVWTAAYRCVDCGRWFHRDCIRRHFNASSSHESTSPFLVTRLGAAVADGLTRPLRAFSYPIVVGTRLFASGLSLAWGLGPFSFLPGLDASRRASVK
jgi:hypothetical protein